ncbi:MAG: C40 family peptidase [Spirochaetaceae bacterium]|jgi:probable lipoprotein NlpC|nr:C40 family peptidase [Spirochaetaceae bacterium]
MLAGMKRPLVILILALLPGGSIFAAVPLAGVDPGDAAAARRRLVSAAESYLGTPYRYGGVGRGGLDCSGLIYLSFRDALRVEPPRTVAALYAWVEKIPAGGLAPGDLVFFVTEGREVSHAGIYTGEGRFIHAASEGARTGVIQSGLDAAYWKRTFAGAGRALPASPEDPLAGRALPEAASHTPPGETGFFAGFGLALTWGAFFEGSPSPLRGVSGQIRAGYRGLLHPQNQAALELRPEWDGALGVFRLPLTLALGTGVFQVFAGPALTFGSAELKTGRVYRPLGWLGGLTAALPPVKTERGEFSFFGELCWQPHSAEAGQGDNAGADMTANLRVSLGLSYRRFKRSREN